MGGLIVDSGQVWLSDETQASPRRKSARGCDIEPGHGDGIYPVWAGVNEAGAAEQLVADFSCEEPAALLRKLVARRDAATSLKRLARLATLVTRGSQAATHLELLLTPGLEEDTHLALLSALAIAPEELRARSSVLLDALLQRSKPPVAAAALECVGGPAMAERWLPTVLGQLARPERNVVAAAAGALVRVADHCNATLSARLVEAFDEVLDRGRGDEKVLIEVFKRCWLRQKAAGTADAWLTNRLGHPNPAVRLRAAYHLRRRPGLRDHALRAWTEVLHDATASLDTRAQALETRAQALEWVTEEELQVPAFAKAVSGLAQAASPRLARAAAAALESA